MNFHTHLVCLQKQFSVSLSCPASLHIKQVKNIIHARTSIPVAEQVLSIKRHGVTVLDNERRLYNYGIKESDVLTLEILPACERKIVVTVFNSPDKSYVVNGTDTIRQVLDRVGLDARAQVVFRSSLFRILLSHSLTVDQCGLWTGAVLETCPSDQLIKVNVKPVKGGEMSFSVAHFAPISTLQQLIFDEKKIEPETQHLIYEQRPLEKVRTFDDERITHGSTLRLVQLKDHAGGVAWGDELAEHLSAHVPEPGATGVPLDAPVELHFAGSVKSVTCVGLFKIICVGMDGGLRSPSGETAYNANTRTATFTPKDGWVPGMLYSVTVFAAHVEGDGPCQANLEFSFTTKHSDPLPLFVCRSGQAPKEIMFSWSPPDLLSSFLGSVSSVLGLSMLDVAMVTSRANELDSTTQIQGPADVVQIKRGSEITVFTYQDVLPDDEIPSPMPPASHDVPICHFQDLRMLKCIGKGITADVWLAEWSGRLVAVKQLRLAGEGEDAMKVFRLEVEMLSRLRHPRVLSLLGVCFSPEVCLVTANCESGSLYDVLHVRKTSLSHCQLLRIAIDISQGMEYLHHCRVVHRDLKSKNVLLDRHGRAIVGDFGIARTRELSQTLVSGTTGTPAWMAPEALQGENIGPAADIYGFGVVLWELFTRQVPWAELHPTQIIGAVGFAGKRLQIPTHLDEGLARVLESCFGPPGDRMPFHALTAELADLLATEIAKEGDVYPQELVCPMTQMVMQDPVTASDGCTYERASIEAWLRRNSLSPANKKDISKDPLVPHTALQQKISTFMSKMPPL